MSGRAAFHAMLSNSGYVDVTDGEDDYMTSLMRLSKVIETRSKLTADGIQSCGNLECCKAAELQCARCKGNGISVWYCSRECQKKDYKEHKEVRIRIVNYFNPICQDTCVGSISIHSASSFDLYKHKEVWKDIIIHFHLLSRHQCWTTLNVLSRRGPELGLQGM
jgi:hypothetical protein